MNVENAAVFLANSILVGAGFCIVFIVVIFINNLLHKYWKPVRIFSADSWHINPPQRFATDDEIQKMKDKEPIMGDPIVPKDYK
jgi:hypothetical protein